MLPIEALSRLRATRLSPEDAWAMSCDNLHVAMGWSAVAAYALKTQPELHPDLFAIVSSVTAGDNASIAAAFERLQQFSTNKSAPELAPVLAVWAAQTQIEGCTVADLVKSTPLNWRWDVAVALMPLDNLRPEHQTLVNALNMDVMARHQSSSQHVDPSILSTVFSP